MEISIEWSHQSIRQIRSIYNYYSQKASPEIAKRITKRITKKVDILFKNPTVGQKEVLLAHLSYDYRYLVESNYKIIYWQEKNTIIIASVFDCRQNPRKITNIK